MPDRDLPAPAVRAKWNAAIAAAMGWQESNDEPGAWVRQPWRPGDMQAYHRHLPDYLGGDPALCEEMEAALLDADGVDWVEVYTQACVAYVSVKAGDNIGGWADREIHGEGATKAEALAKALLAAGIATVEKED